LKTLWFDFTNPPHVNFYLPLIKYFNKRGFHTIQTARDFVETIKLLKLYNIPFSVFGKHGGKYKISKLIQLINRNISLLLNIDSFDISFSSNYDAPFVSWLKRKPALVFDDNDISPNWLYSRFAKYVISPEAIDKNAMLKMGIRMRQLITYNGFKENIYIADYTPDPDFPSLIPFSNFITIRPENLKASYVNGIAKSIVPELVTKLVKKGFNILYLPRYESDMELIQPSEQIYIPSNPLNGLDVCFYSMAVLTGAGTFSREAAIMGVPAVSFYAGNNFLGVDKKMFAEKMVFFSRNSDDIVQYVMTTKKKIFNKAWSIEVQQNFLQIINNLLNQLL
jgi:predicted glycosyltransferase